MTDDFGNQNKSVLESQHIIHADINDDRQEQVQNDNKDLKSPNPFNNSCEPNAEIRHGDIPLSNDYAECVPNAEPYGTNGDCYAILDPKETGFIRGKQQHGTLFFYSLEMPTKVQDYNLNESNLHELTEDSGYDSSINIRQKAAEKDIYNHSVESVNNHIKRSYFIGGRI